MPSILDLLTKAKFERNQSNCCILPHNAPVPYPTMHQFKTEICTILLQNRALWAIALMHCRICEKDELIPNYTIK